MLHYQKKRGGHEVYGKSGQEAADYHIIQKGAECTPWQGSHWGQTGPNNTDGSLEEMAEMCDVITLYNIAHKKRCI